MMRQAVCIVLCLLLSLSVGYAQGDWNVVKAVPVGAIVRVELARGRNAEGTVENIDDTQITILTKRGSTTAARSDVRRIDQIGSKRNVARHVGWGLLIGVVAGTTIGYSTAEGSKGTWAALMGLGWGAIGATIGAIEGLQSRERTVIYTGP